MVAATIKIYISLEFYRIGCQDRLIKNKSVQEVITSKSRSYAKKTDV